jgi:capsular exopolysaccharide synthesis family protein
MRLAAAEAVWRTALDSPDDSLPEVIQSPLIAELRQQHAELSAELGEKARKFGADWPGVQTLSAKMEQARTVLDDQIGRIARQVRTAAQSDYQRARVELGNLDHLLDDQEGAAQQLKRESVEYANLQSEVDKKRETLSALITRQNEMALATRLADLEATSSNIRLLSPAEPPVHPFKPAVRFNLLLGLLIGLGAGVALVIVLERLDNTVSSIEDLRRAGGWPLLAVIPHHERSAGAAAPLLRLGRRGRESPGETVDLVTQHAGQGPSAEGYRDLRTAILLSSPGHPPRTLMITSALPEEGKSATAINLAVVLAHTEARVLLIDTDLRRPRLHRAFGTSNVRGVTSYLSGMDRDVRGLVQRTAVEGLDLLASGPVPPNPSELLNSPQFRELAAHLLESGYQHLVFDSPPVLSVSDPVIAATSMECCILVVRADRTPRPSVRLAVDKLAAAVGGTAGVVLNDLDPSRWGRGYYGGTYYGGGHRAEAEASDAGAVEPARARSRRRGA